MLEAGGTAIEHVVKVGVFLRSMDDFPVFNRVFKEYFKGVQPARTTVEASAPRKGVNVEIDCIAWIPYLLTGSRQTVSEVLWAGPLGVPL